ncbi:MAG: lipid-A-disaccharide synthase N-terminal domain-containing protein [Rhodobacteraceae bacterium]|nr:lipid-A-disaccharide synthase N-terminal domain-containing protein [Paracoccaceae bacterium]
MTIEAIWSVLHVQSWSEFWWVTVGLCGQILFMMRFLVQWVQSERERRSVIPLAFWYFSLGGGLVLLSYAIWRRDPVFILGQSTGLFIYSRNLWLIHAEKRRQG